MVALVNIASRTLHLGPEGKAPARHAGDTGIDTQKVHHLGGLAHLGERQNGILKVAGSSPASSILELFSWGRIRFDGVICRELGVAGVVSSLNGTKHSCQQQQRLRERGRRGLVLEPDPIKRSGICSVEMAQTRSSVKESPIATEGSFLLWEGG